MVLTPAQNAQAKADKDSVYSSPIGKKILTGVTGLGLTTFVVGHLLGNLTLFLGVSTYNQLAHRLDSLGALLYLVELGLLAIVSVHAAIGIGIYLGKRQARPKQYEEYESAGRPSRQTLASRTMIFSGGLLAVFLVWHVATFKFGPAYSLPNSTDRDLARLVLETFQQPTYAVSYVVILSFLGLHLRHGLWSAFQSMGIATKPGMVAASSLLGSAIALGFISLPIAIYFRWL
ncbi:succinate dehydrogenase cytochrome b subunit [cf. Phormidesmis sp. LEGE 11477]|uniref:succinate dehydrogenase cytochrome b subunit n=1 Tax=cf. Phormidesmis sp. LEGE 11477 TaxID=1828680 RepID=UPI001882CD09|nr:succinate dehydrogenase cytochrome b subunit [cf. Phormidesmis sp. LEGE 11477]MBE9062079.1 succinate dehydrogenase cytochrome b subunit [cf. Phormidesmis sp. LEGE 11477]